MKLHATGEKVFLEIREQGVSVAHSARLGFSVDGESREGSLLQTRLIAKSAGFSIF